MMRGNCHINTTKVRKSLFTTGKKYVAVCIALMMSFYSVPSGLAATFGTDKEQSVFGENRGGSNTLGVESSVSVDSTGTTIAAPPVLGGGLSSSLGTTTLQGETRTTGTLNILGADSRPGGDLFEEPADASSTIPDEMRNQIGQLETKVSDTFSTWTFYRIDTEQVTEFHEQYKAGHSFTSANGSGVVQKTDNFYQIDDDYNEPLNEFQTGSRQKTIPDWDYVKWIYQEDPNDGQTWTSYVFDVSGSELDMGNKVKDIGEFMGEVQRIRADDLTIAIAAKVAELGHPLTDAELEDVKTAVYAQIDYASAFGENFHLTSVSSLYKDPANNNAIDGTLFTQRDYNNDRVFDTADRSFSKPEQIAGLGDKEYLSMSDTQYDQAAGFNPISMSWSHEIDGEIAGTKESITEVFSKDTSAELNELIYEGTALSFNPFLAEYNKKIGDTVDPPRTLFANQIIRNGKDLNGIEDNTTIYENDYADASGRPDGKIDSRSKSFSSLSMPGLYDAESYSWLDNDADGTWDESSWGYEGSDDNLRITEAYEGQYTLTDLRDVQYATVFPSRISYQKVNNDSFTEYDNGVENADQSFSGDPDGTVDTASLFYDPQKLAKGDQFSQTDYEYKGVFGDMSMFNPSVSVWTHKDTSANGVIPGATKDLTISESFSVDVDASEVAKTYAEITAEAQADPAARVLFPNRVSWRHENGESTMIAYDNGKKEIDNSIINETPDGLFDSASLSWDIDKLLDDNHQFSQTDFDYKNGVFDPDQASWSYMHAGKGLIVTEVYQERDQIDLWNYASLMLAIHEDTNIDGEISADETTIKANRLNPNSMSWLNDTLSSWSVYDYGVKQGDGSYDGIVDGVMDSASKNWGRDYVRNNSEQFSQTDYELNLGVSDVVNQTETVFEADVINWSYVHPTKGIVVTETYNQREDVVGHELPVLNYLELMADVYADFSGTGGLEALRKAVVKNAAGNRALLPNRMYWWKNNSSSWTVYDNGVEQGDGSFNGNPDGIMDTATAAWNSDLLRDEKKDQFAQTDFSLGLTFDVVVNQLSDATFDPVQVSWSHQGMVEGAAKTITEIYEKREGVPILSYLDLMKDVYADFNNSGATPEANLAALRNAKTENTIANRVYLPNRQSWAYDTNTMFTEYDYGTKAGDSYAGNPDGTMDSAGRMWNMDQLKDDDNEQFSQTDYDYAGLMSKFDPDVANWSFLHAGKGIVVTESYNQREDGAGNELPVLSYLDLMADVYADFNNSGATPEANLAALRNAKTENTIANRVYLPNRMSWWKDTVSSWTVYDNGVKQGDGSYVGNPDGTMDTATQAWNSDLLRDEKKDQFAQTDFDLGLAFDVVIDQLSDATFDPVQVSWSHQGMVEGEAKTITEIYEKRKGVPLWSYLDLMKDVYADFDIDTSPTATPESNLAALRNAKTENTTANRVYLPNRQSWAFDTNTMFTEYDYGIKAGDSYEGNPDGTMDSAGRMWNMDQLRDQDNEQFSQTDYEYAGLMSKFDPDVVNWSFRDDGMGLIVTETYNQRTDAAGTKLPIWEYQDLMRDIFVDTDTSGEIGADEATIRTDRLNPNRISHYVKDDANVIDGSFTMYDNGVRTPSGDGYDIFVGDPDGVVDSGSVMFDLETLYPNKTARPELYPDGEFDRRTQFSYSDFEYNLNRYDATKFDPTQVAYSYFDAKNQGGLDVVMTEFYDQREVGGNEVPLWTYAELIDAINSGNRILYPNRVSRPFLVGGTPDGTNLTLYDNGIQQGTAFSGDPDGVLDRANRSFPSAMIDGVEESHSYYWMDFENDGVFDNVIWGDRVVTDNRNVRWLVSDTYQISEANRLKVAGDDYKGTCDFNELGTNACFKIGGTRTRLDGLGGVLTSWIQDNLMIAEWLEQMESRPNTWITENYQGVHDPGYSVPLINYEDIQKWVDDGQLAYVFKKWDVRRNDETTEYLITAFQERENYIPQTFVERFKTNGDTQWKKKYDYAFTNPDQQSAGDWITFTVPQYATSTDVEFREIEFQRDDEATTDWDESTTSLIVTDLVTKTVYQEYHEGHPRNLPPALWPNVRETHLNPLNVVKETHTFYEKSEAAVLFPNIMNNNAGEYSGAEMTKYHDISWFENETGQDLNFWDSDKATVVAFYGNVTPLVRRNYYEGASAVSESSLTGTSLETEFINWDFGRQYIYRDVDANKIWAPPVGGGTGWRDLTSSYNTFLGSPFVISNPSFANLEGYILREQI